MTYPDPVQAAQVRASEAQVRSLMAASALNAAKAVVDMELAGTIPAAWHGLTYDFDRLVVHAQRTATLAQRTHDEAVQFERADAAARAVQGGAA